jgi:hypothetical protein
MTWTLIPARTQAHIHGKIGEESFVVSVPFKTREDRIVARMMAAAPRMLEALENLENDNGKTMPDTAWKLVCDAIAQAKGWTT